MGDIAETRQSRRYVVHGLLTGYFGGVDVAIRDISETGMQVEHAAPLKPGLRARLGVYRAGTTIVFSASIVWCRLSTVANEQGKFVYRSGVRLDTSAAALLRDLVRERLIAEDASSLEKKRQKLAARAAPKDLYPAMKIITRAPSIPADALLLVQQARSRLRSQPDEALRWYNRAKYAMAEHASELTDSAYREEIFAVWEYLERSLSLQTIALAFETKIP